MKKTATFAMALALAAICSAQSDEQSLTLLPRESALLSAANNRLYAGPAWQLSVKLKTESFGCTKHGEFYGGFLGYQTCVWRYKTLALWLGAEASFMPKQHFASRERPYTLPAYLPPPLGGASVPLKTRLRVTNYGLRLMVIPEWSPTEYLHIAARGGVGGRHVSGTLTNQSLDGNPLVGSVLSASGKDKVHGAENVFVCNVGGQFTWDISERCSLMLYSDVYFGENPTATKAKVCSTFVEMGLGLTYTF